VRPEDMPELQGQVLPISKSYNPELAMRDMAVFIDFLSRQPEVLPDKFAVTGYCMGGRLALRAAIQFPDKIAAAASFHAGNLATEAPDSLHLHLGQIKAEIYIAFADQDKSMPPEQIDRLQKALEKSGLKYEAELYPGAAHGFTMADLPAYHEASLKRHWEKLFALLERNLERNHL
jgi:carboxymethylenebutenolidase